MVLADCNTEDSDKSIPFFYILNGFLFIADSAISVILLLLDLSAVCDGCSQMALIQLNSSCVM